MREAANAYGEGRERRGQEEDVARGKGDIDWGEYEPAIRRWETILDRLAPSPTEIGPKGNVRLSPHFVEWMMGLPLGWVTDLGFTRKDMFRLLGNGVVPLQAALAIKGLLDEESNSGVDGWNGSGVQRRAV